MSSIRKTDTKPELIVRRFLHARGFRYRLHDRKLPGSPDLVLPGRRAVVLVHGCFWHRCPHCTAGRAQPRTNVDYWRRKLARNQARDLEVALKLKGQGWAVLTIWECQMGKAEQLERLASDLAGCARQARASSSQSLTASGDASIASSRS